MLIKCPCITRCSTKTGSKYSKGTTTTEATNPKETTRQEKLLKQKEKDIKEKTKKLNKKIEKFKKKQRIQDKRKAESEKKLQNARKNLERIVYAKDKVEKYKKKKDRQSKSRSKKQSNRKFDLHSCLYNYLSKGINQSQRKSTCGYKHYDSCFQKLFAKNKNYCSFREKCMEQMRATSALRGCLGNGHRPRSSFPSGAGDCYLMSLRQTPQLWLYDRWPSCYPHYLNARAQWKNLGFCLLLSASLIFWLPLLICFELCMCCCSSDCC